MSEAVSANGFQTGLSVFPSVATVTSSGIRTIQFSATGGLSGNVGITWGLAAGAKGTITPGGLYSPPASISSVSTDQVLALAVDGSQAQALVTLMP
jgi:hypothetical protein